MGSDGNEGIDDGGEKDFKNMPIKKEIFLAISRKDDKMHTKDDYCIFEEIILAFLTI